MKTKQDHWIGFMPNGKLYGPADPEMVFSSRDEAIEFALSEGIGSLEHWVDGSTVDSDAWCSAENIDSIALAAKKEIAERELVTHNWMLNPAAKALGSDPRTLRRLISDCGLDDEYARRNPGRGRPSSK